MKQTDEVVDYYYSIEKIEETEIKIKGSKFIGYVEPTSSKEEASSVLARIQSKHYDATHNCFAYKLGSDENNFRYSDDGEPTGTAGKPIFLALGKYKFSDIIVVVTRYFGGTKLGVGGLIRAYSDTAEEVLKLCTPKIINLTKSVMINCQYEEISLVKRLVNETAISFVETYTDKIEIIAQIPNSQVVFFINKISLKTNARASAKLLLDKNN
jgi:uncharacterized YigZ family protein